MQVSGKSPGGLKGQKLRDTLKAFEKKKRVTVALTNRAIFRYRAEGEEKRRRNRRECGILNGIGGITMSRAQISLRRELLSLGYLFLSIVISAREREPLDIS